MTRGVSAAAGAGWALVEAQFDRGRTAGVAFLRIVRSNPGNGAPGDVLALPVSMAGRVHELVQLPQGTVGIEWAGPDVSVALPSSFRVRSVGWFERTWRMWKRVNDRFAALSPEQRQNLGLSRRKIVADLPAAYRVVTGFRWCIEYPDWIARADGLRPADVSAILEHIRAFDRTPHFHVLVLNDGGAVDRTLESLRDQYYRNFTCTVFPSGGAQPPGHELERPLPGIGVGSARVSQYQVDATLARFLEERSRRPEDNWLIVCRAGDTLAPHALYWFAHEAAIAGETVVIYCDDDEVDAEGIRMAPRFKPDWSLTHYRAHDFVGNAVALRRDAVAAVGGISSLTDASAPFDTLLRVVDWAGDAGKKSVRHLPAMLFHRRAGTTTAAATEQASRECLDAVRAHLRRCAIDGEVSVTRPDVRRVSFRLTNPPTRVSVIIPTRDAVETLRVCVESLLRLTDYPDYEVLIVDNQSETAEAKAYLAELTSTNAPERLRVLQYDYPFNYSAINNFAVARASGEVLCLLNNDTEVITPGWLAEMVGHLLQDSVGAVGAKLLYPDGRVQHAGDTVGPGGCANHLHAFIGRDDAGYCNRAIAAQELSAVTAACLVTRKDLYLRLGGLDAGNLPVAFNDVDFCLRVRKAGFSVVWTPHAVLYHHESLTRGADKSRGRRRRARREVAYMRHRWKHTLSRDPFYNPNLSYERPDFSLSHSPRVRKPWLAR